MSTSLSFCFSLLFSSFIQNTFASTVVDFTDVPVQTVASVIARELAEDYVICDSVKSMNSVSLRLTIRDRKSALLALNSIGLTATGSPIQICNPLHDSYLVYTPKNIKASDLIRMYNGFSGSAQSGNDSSQSGTSVSSSLVPAGPSVVLHCDGKKCDELRSVLESLDVFQHSIDLNLQLVRVSDLDSFERSLNTSNARFALDDSGLTLDFPSVNLVIADLGSQAKRIHNEDVSLISGQLTSYRYGTDFGVSQSSTTGSTTTVSTNLLSTGVSYRLTAYLLNDGWHLSVQFEDSSPSSISSTNPVVQTATGNTEVILRPGQSKVIFSTSDRSELRSSGNAWFLPFSRKSSTSSSSLVLVASLKKADVTRKN